MFKKRKSSADLAALFAFVGIILTGLAIISSATTFDVANKAQISNEYLISSGDSGIRSIEQSFEKTALFFSLMNASKELGAHGGVSSEVVSKADSMIPKMYTEQDVPYLAVALCADGSRGCETKKRMPFVSYNGYNEKVGTATTKYLLIDSEKYAQNIEEVKRGNYKFYALVQVFMLKEGVVALKVCRGTSCPVTETMSATGTKQIVIDGSALGNSGEDVNLAVSGSSENVAVLRQIAVSIYDKDVVESANKLLEANVNNYQKSVASFTRDGLKFTVGKFSTAFVPSGGGLYGTLDPKQGFIRGVAWAPEKITAMSDDVFVSSSGIAEEDAKIRYWRMYGFAEYFVDNLGENGILKPRVENKMQAVKVKDYDDSRSWRQCPAQSYYFPLTCPPPPEQPSYSASEFSDALVSGLDDLTKDLNDKYASEGFSWKISLPEGGLGDSNVEQKAYSFPHFWDGVLTNDCCLSYDGVCAYYWRYCTTRATYEYIIKNIKIRVEITDEKYKYFDSATNTWEKPKFKFFVELDSADDNYCKDNAGKWYNCRTLGDATFPEPAEIIVPEN